MTQQIVVMGAGPAGLTAALELQAQGVKDIVVVEAASQVGGISRTVNYKDNRIDIGGHRFFSKSDWVMNWWTSVLPIAMPSGAAAAGAAAPFLQYQGKTRPMVAANAPANAGDDVMLVRSRLSRIYYNRRFFDYPLKLNLDTVRKLGLYKTVTFGFSYVGSRLNPVKPEKSLEDFLVNRFGRRLYRQFFKEYTEKVWGVPCREISAEWGAQRIKSLSVTKALWHAFKNAIGLGGGKAAQTSLIESFIYPKHGPGQMWETVARRFTEAGGTLLMNTKVVGVDIEGGAVRGVRVCDALGAERTLPCTHAISTLPIKDLIAASRPAWSAEVQRIGDALQYRDFITVGLLYRKKDIPRPLSDNWIYIQEPGVNVGRVQVFNNWSPFMVADPDTVWLGLEFFCVETDKLWTMGDDELRAIAMKEMREIDLVSADKALDAVVIRVPKAYPGYFGEAYTQFDTLREALDKVPNLFLVGRNGMHRYNNQDHSMLTAKEAADQIASGRVEKSRIWDINIDDEYHEEKK